MASEFPSLFTWVPRGYLGLSDAKMPTDSRRQHGSSCCGNWASYFQYNAFNYWHSLTCCLVNFFLSSDERKPEKSWRNISYAITKCASSGAVRFDGCRARRASNGSRQFANSRLDRGNRPTSASRSLTRCSRAVIYVGRRRAGQPEDLLP